MNQSDCGKPLSGLYKYLVTMGEKWDGQIKHFLKCKHESFYIVSKYSEICLLSENFIQIFEFQLYIKRKKTVFCGNDGTAQIMNLLYFTCHIISLLLF